MADDDEMIVDVLLDQFTRRALRSKQRLTGRSAAQSADNTLRPDPARRDDAKTSRAGRCCVSYGATAQSGADVDGPAAKNWIGYWA